MTDQERKLAKEFLRTMVEEAIRVADEERKAKGRELTDSELKEIADMVQRQAQLAVATARGATG